MQLSRFDTMWDHVLDLEQVRHDELQEGMVKAVVRPNRFEPTIVLSSLIGIELEDVPRKFQQLKLMLQGRCKSMKFYFHSDRKDFPLSELDILGFKKESPQIWVHDHPDYSVSAIAITTYKECEWILQVEKRRGKGLPDHAADFGMLFDRQLKLDLNNIGVNVS